MLISLTLSTPSVDKEKESNLHALHALFIRMDLPLEKDCVFGEKNKIFSLEFWGSVSRATHSILGSNAEVYIRIKDSVSKLC